MPFSIEDTLSIEDTGGKLVLRLEGSVTIRHARDLAALLGERLEKDTPVRVVTENLESTDTAILQMLCSLRKTVAGVSFDNPSATFTRAVERSGLRRELSGARECS